MFKGIAALTLVVVAALAGWLYVRGSRPPEVPFVRAVRAKLESAVTTNGKAEPIAWAVAGAEAEGTIESVPVARGQSVRRGQILAVLDARQARADLAAAEARIAQVMADIQTLESGGRSADLAEIDSGIKRAQLDRDLAQRDLDSVTRLAAKNAATRTEVQEASDRLARSQTQIQTLSAKRASLVSRGDLASAQARLRHDQSAADLARERIARSEVRAPLDGVVYQLDARPGAYLTPGSSVARVGRIDRLKVIVYVDEPELGRVRAGMPVTITWDAMPGREWRGAVDRTPTQVVALGTRQVGEVACLIDNPGAAILPGTNLNATVHSEADENALTIPKESVLRQDGQTGVWLLDGQKVRWRPVQLGIASITRVAVATGLKEGDEVALPSAVPLREALEVTPDHGAPSGRH